MDMKVAVTLAITAAMTFPILLAAQSKPAAGRKYINGPKHDPKLPFSDGVLVGDTLFVSGKIGIDPKTGQAPADMNAEIKYLLDNFQETVEQAGMKMDDLAWVQVFCTDLTLFDTFNAAYKKRFTRDLPARAFIGSNAILRGGHFEIMGIAVKK